MIECLPSQDISLGPPSLANPPHNCSSLCGGKMCFFLVARALSPQLEEQSLPQGVQRREAHRVSSFVGVRVQEPFAILEFHGFLRSVGGKAEADEQAH